MVETEQLKPTPEAMPLQVFSGPEPAKNGATLKIDFGCGKNKREGFFGVDSIKYPGVDMVVDLADVSKPYPWEDNSVAEAHASHFLEHLDSIERIHFLNELYRILIPNGPCQVIVPHWASGRAYGDPTHKMPPVCEFATYYWRKDWRDQNAPHTDAENWPLGFKCNFDVQGGANLHPLVAMRNREFQEFAMVFYKEAAQDSIWTLRALK